MSDRLRELFDAVAAGAMTPDEAASAASAVSAETVADLGFAAVDLGRKDRCGFPEVIYCEGKPVEMVVGVVERLAAAGQDVLGTRVSDEQASELSRRYPHAEQDRLARTFWMPTSVAERQPVGRVLVLTAGTTDLPVAREAAVTAAAMGAGVELVADVGVAGLQRLLRHLDKVRTADAIVVVAGMDGALPSVVGGLASCPVVAVPTSIGYGAAFSGMAALLTMLNACSAGVVTVNIDAGFKGGYVAALIAKGRGS